MDTLKSILAPLNHINSKEKDSTSKLKDTFNLVVVGSTFETARRVSISAWHHFIDSFFLTAHFSESDFPYDWMMHWLSKQPSWGRSREFDITTRAITGNSITESSSADVEESDEETEEDDDVLVSGRMRKRKVNFLPSIDTTHTIFYRGHWLWITRTKPNPESRLSHDLKISVFARSNDILKKLVLEAKKEYEKDAEHRVHIYMADPKYVYWRWNGSRQKRSLDSIVLPPNVKEMLVDDCKDFLCSEDWYARRGIPFRRGYLLHGVPGSGKSSLIHAIAGELGLDIYVITLSSKEMSDELLTKFMGLVPSRSILLLEDLDAAFTRSVDRDESSTGSPDKPGPFGSARNRLGFKEESSLSLSGLLNSLDGISASEGRILFATTNHVERLDTALSRPGRMDVWINFTHATKWQAERIYKNFFTSKDHVSGDKETGADKSAGIANKNVRSGQKSIEISVKESTKKKGKKGCTTPSLTEEEAEELAKQFSEKIPEDELCVASLQGYLLKNKRSPRECIDGLEQWIAEERKIREKIKDMKEEKKETEDTKEKLKEAFKDASDKAREKNMAGEEKEGEKAKMVKPEEQKAEKVDENNAEMKTASSNTDQSVRVSTESDANDAAPAGLENSLPVVGNNANVAEVTEGGHFTLLRARRAPRGQRALTRRRAERSRSRPRAHSLNLAHVTASRVRGATSRTRRRRQAMEAQLEMRMSRATRGRSSSRGRVPSHFLAQQQTATVATQGRPRASSLGQSSSPVRAAVTGHFRNVSTSGHGCPPSPLSPLQVLPVLLALDSCTRRTPRTQYHPNQDICISYF